MYGVMLWKARYTLYPDLLWHPDWRTIFFRQTNWAEELEKIKELRRLGGVEMGVRQGSIDVDEGEDEDGGNNDRGEGQHGLSFLVESYEGHAFWSVGSGEALASKLVH